MKSFQVATQMDVLATVYDAAATAQSNGKCVV